MGILAFTFQIYFDFSGYCDMAIGIGLMFNIILPVNFSSPYQAGNIQEFWRRWHITLGRFLSQFVYFPLGGSRKGEGRAYLNLALTFFVSGLWHGANWMMIFWGCLHGVAMMLHRFWKKVLNKTMPHWLGVSLTFLFVWLVWIFFRAENMTQAVRVLSGFTDFSPEKFKVFCHSFSGKDLLLYLISAGIIFFLPPANSFRERFKPALWNLAVAIVLLICSVFSFHKISPFIYFNF